MWLEMAMTQGNDRIFTENQTLPLEDVTNAHERTNNANVPHRDLSPIPLTQTPRPHCLENTPKPSGNLRHDMSPI